MEGDLKRETIKVTAAMLSIGQTRKAQTNTQLLYPSQGGKVYPFVPSARGDMPRLSCGLPAYREIEFRCFRVTYVRNQLNPAGRVPCPYPPPASRRQDDDSVRRGSVRFIARITRRAVPFFVPQSGAVDARGRSVKWCRSPDRLISAGWFVEPIVAFFDSSRAPGVCCVVVLSVSSRPVRTSPSEKTWCSGSERRPPARCGTSPRWRRRS